MSDLPRQGRGWTVRRKTPVQGARPPVVGSGARCRAGGRARAPPKLGRDLAGVWIFSRTPGPGGETSLARSSTEESAHPPECRAGGPAGGASARSSRPVVSERFGFARLRATKRRQTRRREGGGRRRTRRSAHGVPPAGRRLAANHHHGDSGLCANRVRRLVPGGRRDAASRGELLRARARAACSTPSDATSSGGGESHEGSGPRAGHSCASPSPHPPREGPEASCGRDRLRDRGPRWRCRWAEARRARRGRRWLRHAPRDERGMSETRREGVGALDLETSTVPAVGQLKPTPGD